MQGPSSNAEHEYTRDELIQFGWEMGDLRLLMHAGQIRLITQIQDWLKIDQTNDVEHVAGSMPRVFAVAKAKRFGGTTAMLWLLAMLGVKHPGAVMRFTSALQKSIDEIIGAVVPQCFATAPESCTPKYFGKRGPKPAGLYFPEYGPMCGARIALAGLDQNPNALRGQANDFDVISEAAFVEKLDYTLRNVIYHQYQGRPHARAIVESSAPKDLDTDWELTYLPDCKQRGAYFSATIDDNPRLPQKEKEEFIAAAGGRGHPDCEREYYNVIAGDPALQLFPEFKELVHVLDSVRPAHAYCITAADPGTTHQFGLVFGYYDFDRATAVIQDSWAESNASTRKVACVIAAREFDLWGTWPPHEMRLIPQFTEGKHEGWHDLLAKDRCHHLADALYKMANTPLEQRPMHERFPGMWITREPERHFTFYDGKRFHPNPYVRVSDIDARYIRDVDAEFGLRFSQANKKDTLAARVNLVRNGLGGGGLEFSKGAGVVIDHCRAGKWNSARTKFAEHQVYSHFDAAAAATYFNRGVHDYLKTLRPHPPGHLLTGQQVMSRLPWRPQLPHEQELQRIRDALYRSGGAKDQSRIRSYRDERKSAHHRRNP